jgi:hypothetical protein
MPTPYDPMELKRFLDQWKPEPEEPYYQLALEFSELIGDRVYFTRHETQLLLALYGYVIDDKGIIRRRPDLK